MLIEVDVVVNLQLISTEFQSGISPLVYILCADLAKRFCTGLYRLSPKTGRNKKNCADLHRLLQVYLCIFFYKNLHRNFTCNSPQVFRFFLWASYSVLFLLNIHNYCSNIHFERERK